MEVSFGQIYTEVGASFPFSYRMQVWLSKRISRLAAPGPKFVTKYGADFALIAFHANPDSSAIASVNVTSQNAQALSTPDVAPAFNHDRLQPQLRGGAGSGISGAATSHYGKIIVW